MLDSKTVGGWINAYNSEKVDEIYRMNFGNVWVVVGLVWGLIEIKTFLNSYKEIEIILVDQNF